jgi:hypothetical protein
MKMGSLHAGDVLFFGCGYSGILVFGIVVGGLSGPLIYMYIDGIVTSHVHFALLWV